MSEDEQAYRISAELPGIDAKDIDVSVSGDAGSQGRKTPGEGGERQEQELSLLRALLRLVPTLV
jgi:HSP20 family molecular chaperone IbpA